MDETTADAARRGDVGDSRLGQAALEDDALGSLEQLGAPDLHLLGAARRAHGLGHARDPTGRIGQFANWSVNQFFRFGPPSTYTPCMVNGGPPAGGGRVELVALRRQFGEHVAVDGIDLDIPGGEFFSLLGPSGCGKTTTLRMIAGFEPPTSGQILLDGVDMAHTPAHKRPVNTVFQSYALFPHLTVERNVAYGLRWRRDLSKARQGSGASAAPSPSSASSSSPQRKPHQMSGGQQQRVALARALILVAAGAAARRAAGCARREAAYVAALRADLLAARGRHHLRLRHPRPG